MLLGPLGLTDIFFFCSGVSKLSGAKESAYSICESSFLIHQDVYHDLFVCY